MPRLISRVMISPRFTPRIHRVESVKGEGNGNERREDGREGGREKRKNKARKEKKKEKKRKKFLVAWIADRSGRTF